MTATASANSKNRYYVSRPRVAKNRCKRRGLPYGQAQIKAEVIEHAAWEYLFSLMTNDGEFEAQIGEAQALEEGAKEPKREQLVSVLEIIAEAEKKLRTWPRLSGTDPAV
jgi:hypothetical protein